MLRGFGQALAAWLCLLAICAAAKEDQTITFGTLPKSTFGDNDFDPGATASSNLTVSYASSNTDVATITTGGQIHILRVGTSDITASQSGDDDYNAAPEVMRTLTVKLAAPVITAPAAHSPPTIVDTHWPEFTWGSVYGASQYCLSLWDAT